MSLLGIDVGTTATKVVAFARDGTPLAAATEEYRFLTPAPGRAELDPEGVWAAVARCLRAVNGRVAADPVEALAVSAQGEAVVPVDRAGAVRAASPVTADNRSVAEAARLEAALGREEWARLTGQPPHPMFTIAKLAWWREHEPELVRQTWKFFCYDGFVALRLGGAPAIDHSLAARTMAFDIHRLPWAPDVLAAAGIAADQLPEPVSSGTLIGRLDPAVARDLGFVGTPAIVQGGHDQPCGALGAGVAAAGEAMLAMGTSICLVPVFSRPRLELLAAGLPCYPHVVPGAFVSVAGNLAGASLLRWFRDRFGAEERRLAAETGRDVYDLLVEQAGDEPSPLLLLPHFAGAGAPQDDPAAKGALVGLTFGTTRGQVVRAVLEGVVMQMALAREALAGAGVPIDRVVAAGGGARADRWLQIAADVLALPIRRSSQPEAACWGAARLAAAGAGLLPGPAAKGATPADSAPCFAPDPERAEYYRGRLELFRSLYEALRPVSHAL